MPRLYNRDSEQTRETRIRALYSVRSPIREVTAEERAEDEVEFRMYGSSWRSYERQLDQETMRERWLQDLRLKRRDELDQFEDPVALHAGMIGALRSILFREPRVADIPRELNHPDIIRTIVHGHHGWLIRAFQATLTNYTDAEYEEYIEVCEIMGQPIIRDVRRILNNALHHLLIHYILEIIRNGRIPIQLLQRALINEETGLIDFIVRRYGSMESAANPVNLTNLATSVARRYTVNINDAEFSGEFIAALQQEDARINQLGSVSRQAEGASRDSPSVPMRLTDYRQTTQFELLTDEDIALGRARPRGVHARLSASVGRPTEPLSEDVVLSLTDFNALVRDDNQCIICLGTKEDGQFNVACRHPIGKKGTDICRQAYHDVCLESMKLSRNFHCSRCFVGKSNGITPVIPFRLFYRLDPIPVTRKETNKSRAEMAASRGGNLNIIPNKRRGNRRKTFKI